MDRSDWLLLAVASAKGQPLTPVQLQKVMFLLGERQRDKVGKSFYAFKPYNFGPFSADIYRDADALEQAALIGIDPKKPGRPWSMYAVTEAGADQARVLAQRAPAPTVEYLRRLVEWARSLTFHQLVSAIYQDFPGQRANSIFID